MTMEDPNNWRKFRRLKFDAKSINKHVRKAETASTRHAHRFVLKRLANLRDARRGITTWLVLVGLLILAVGIQMVWFQRAYHTQAPVAGGTYAEGMRGPIKTLNPLYAQTPAELSASRLIFSSLYDYDKTGHLRGDIATQTNVDDSGKKYTVKLRNDVKWHDGQKLTAKDIVFTVNLMKNSNTRAVMQSSWLTIDAAAPDDTTVVFTLPSSNSPFPHALTFAILPEHILGEVEAVNIRENTFSFSPVGSGPFSLRLLQTVGNDTDRKIAYLSRWTDYYRGAPKLDRFEIHTYKNGKEIAKAFEGRDINAAVDPTSEVKITPASEIRSQPIESAVYAILNNDSPVLKDVNVRKALQVGTDTRELRRALAYTTQSFDLPLSSTQIENVELPNAPVKDDKKANEYLDAAGWKKEQGGIRMKDGKQLELKIVAAKDEDYQKAIEVLKKQWSGLGIKVVTQSYDSEQSGQSFAQAVLQPRAYDVLINQLSIGADPDVFAYWHSSQAVAGGFNFANYKSPISDDALLSARVRSEQALREQKYRVFVDQWLNDAASIGLYRSVMVYAQTTKSHSFSEGSITPSTIDRYSDVVYWTVDQGLVYKTP